MGNIYDYYAATDDRQALALFEDDCMDHSARSASKGQTPTCSSEPSKPT
ncbi:hypothetical protein NRF20_00770 [Streptomyces sp. R-74717]